MLDVNTITSKIPFNVSQQICHGFIRRLFHLYHTLYDDTALSVQYMFRLG